MRASKPQGLNRKIPDDGYFRNVWHAHYNRYLIFDCIQTGDKTILDKTNLFGMSEICWNWNLLNNVIIIKPKAILSQAEMVLAFLTILFRPFGFLAGIDFYINWFSSPLTLMKHLMNIIPVHWIRYIRYFCLNTLNFCKQQKNDKSINLTTTTNMKICQRISNYVPAVKIWANYGSK